MSLKAAIQGAVASIFSVADSLTETVLYYEGGAAPSYDPNTGSVSRPTTSHAGVKAIIVQYSEEEVDGTLIHPSDRRALIEAQAVSFVPKLDDRMMVGSEVWDVVAIQHEPSDSVYDLQLRFAGSG